jgi:predicted DNA-binding protein
MVSHRMPRDLIDRLDAHAAATGTTRSDLLRRGAEILLIQEAALVEQHNR